MKNILKLSIFSSAFFILLTLSASAAILSPKLIGSYDTSGYALGISISGNYTYIADGYSGLQILDISTHSAPKLIGSYDTPGIAFDVVVSGNYAYVANQNAGLLIIDISIPNTPVLVGQYDTSGDSSNDNNPNNGISSDGYATGVAVSGNYAYIANNMGGLFIVDVSNVSSPSLVSRIASGSSGITDVMDVTVSGNYAYIVDSNTTLSIIDVSKPFFPAIVGSYYTKGAAQRLFVSGNYAYIGDGVEGLTVVDISNPTAPIHKDTANPLGDNAVSTGNSTGTFVSGDYAYVAVYEVKTNGGIYNKMKIFNISNPSFITLAGEYATPLIKTYNTIKDSVRDVVVSGNYAYIVSSTAGVLVVQIKSNNDILKDLNKDIKVDARLVDKLKGKILLQVESKGEAWYVNPKDSRKYSLGKPSDAFAIIKKLGVGISNANLAKISRNGTKDKGDQEMMNRLKGKILIQAQGKGEAWYVHPVTGKRHSLGKPTDALAVIKKLGIGVSNNNLNKVRTGLVVK